MTDESKLDEIKLVPSRDAALRALYGRDWRRSSMTFPRVERWAAGEELTPSTSHHVPMAAVAVAAAIDRAERAAERAGYERGVREERERCARYAKTVSATIGRNSASHADAWVGKVASDIERGEHAKEGA